MFKKNIQFVFLLLLQYQGMGQASVFLNDGSLVEAGKIMLWKETYENIPYLQQPYDSTDGFVLTGNPIQNFGITDKTIYGQITGLYNYGDSIFLMIDNLQIDSVWVMYSNGYSVQRQFKTSAFSDGSFTARTLVMKIPDPAGKPVLFSFKSKNSMVLPILISDEEGMLKLIRKKHFSESTLLGANIIFMLLILLMFYLNRDSSYLYYFIYAFFTTLFCFFYLRGFSIYLSKDIFNFISRYAYSIGAITSLFSLLFTRRFIQPFKNHKLLIFLLNSFLLFCLLTLIIDIIGIRSTSRIMLQGVGALTPVAAIAYTAYPTRKGNLASLILLPAWLLIGAVMVVYSISTIGVIQFRWFTFTTLPLTTTLAEIMIFGSALAIRYIDLEKEKRILNELMLENLKTQKKRLEEEVVQRTYSLEKTNAMLSQSNQVKARMLSIISHDLKMPIVNINAILDLLTSNLLTVDHSRRKLNDVKQSIGAISNTMENLLIWAKQQQEMIETHKEKVWLSVIVNNIHQLMKGALELKNIQLESFFNTETVVADRFQLETILRNLLTNAIQHSKPDNKIIIGQTIRNGRFSIFVQNHGKAFTRECFNFIMSSNHELNHDLVKFNTGLGLQLCKEFLINHGSVLELEETPHYTRLYFSIDIS